MKKTDKKIFISSEEDRGIWVKFLKNKIHLSFWGDESDVPRKIEFSNDDILAFCHYVSEKLSAEEEETGRQYVTNLLNEMNARNDERR